MLGKVLVFGAGGFIGGHVSRFLKTRGYWVHGVDLKYPEFTNTQEIVDRFTVGDLRDRKVVDKVFTEGYCRVYQFAADMGGAGFCFTGDNDADIMSNSALINLNTLQRAAQIGFLGKLFYASSACVYPDYQQLGGETKLYEHTVYPANPDSEYGWEKLFSERMYLSFLRNKRLDVRIARFHNIFGPQGTYVGGREKAPAALCRKVVESTGEVEIWGDGKQKRSFLYIEDCVEAVELLMESKTFRGPVNIGSEEAVTIDELARMVISLSGKDIILKHIPGPQGVRSRNSENSLIWKEIGWKPKYTLIEGLKPTYEWISQEILKKIS